MQQNPQLLWKYHHIEWLLDDFITALLTEMVVVQESSIQLMVNVAFLLCQPLVCHVPSAVVTARFQDPSSSFLSFVYCLAASHSASNMAFTTGCMRSMVCKRVRIPTALRMLQCSIISNVSAASNNKCHLNTHAYITTAELVVCACVKQCPL